MKTIRLMAIGLVALALAGILAYPSYAALFCNTVSSTTGSGGCGTPIPIGVGTPVVVIPYQTSSSTTQAVIDWSVQLRTGGPMNCGPAGVAGGASPSATPSSTASGAGLQMSSGTIYNMATFPTSLTQGNAFLGLECICQTGTCLVDGWYETGQ